MGTSPDAPARTLGGPDDFPADASTTGRVATDGTVSAGVMEVRDDVDYFAVQMRRGAVYEIRLYGAGALDVIGPDGRLQSHNLAPLAGHDTLDVFFDAAATGTYYISVSSPQMPGDYQLSAWLRNDDFPAGANAPLVVGAAPRQGMIEFDGDTDAYTATLQAGVSYVFDLRQTNSPKLSDPMLRLLGPDGSLLASNDNMAVLPGVDSRIVYTPNVSGSYQVMAADAHDGTGYYTVAASLLDKTPPRLSSQSPADNARNIPRSADLVLQFDKPVYAGSGSIVVHRADGSVLHSFNMADPAVSINGNVLHVDMPGNWAPGAYYVAIDAGIVHDEFANAFAGITGSTAYDFTVTTANRNPVAADARLQATEDTRIDAQLPAGSDPDSDSFDYRVASGPAHGRLSLEASGRLSYQPDADFSGSDSFDYFIRDQVGGSSRYQVTIAVASVKDRFVGTTGTDKMLPQAGADSYEGRDGDDLITPGAGDDEVDGGAGLDTVVLAGPRAGYTLQHSGNRWVASHATEGRDTLTDVERLRFDDMSLALDIGGHAGTVAKIIGAVGGAAALANRTWVGLGLQLLDAGQSPAAVMQVALDALLGADASPESVVQLLYGHVVGSAPDSATLASLTGLLANGSYTPATLGLMAADHPLNIANIDLAGLADTGLAYG